MDKNFHFISFDFKNKKEIYRQSIKNFVLSTYNTFLTKNLDIIFSGYFIRNSVNDIVFYFQHFGAFLLFNPNGTIKKLVKTIDGFPLPKPAEIRRTSTITEITIEPDLIVNYSSCIDKNYIYMLSNVFKKSSINNRIIDIYDLKNGIYLKSITIDNRGNEQKCIAIAINENRIISCLNEDMLIENYKFNDSEIVGIK